MYLHTLYVNDVACKNSPKRAILKYNVLGVLHMYACNEGVTLVECDSHNVHVCGVVNVYVFQTTVVVVILVKITTSDDGVVRKVSHSHESNIV